MPILDAAGQVVGAPITQAERDQQAPVPIEQVKVQVKDGSLTYRAVVDFEDLKVGGPDVAKFTKAMEACLLASGGVGVRMVELMILAAQQGVQVSVPITGCLNDLQMARQALEEIMRRVIAGMEVMPRVQVATGSLPAETPKG